MPVHRQSWDMDFTWLHTRVPRWGGGGGNGLLFRFSLSLSQAFSLPPFLSLYKAIEHAPFFPVYFSVTFLKFTNVKKYNLEEKQAQNLSWWIDQIRNYGPGTRDGASGFDHVAVTVASCSFEAEEFDR